MDEAEISSEGSSASSSDNDEDENEEENTEQALDQALGGENAAAAWEVRLSSNGMASGGHAGPLCGYMTHLSPWSPTANVKYTDGA